MFSALIFRLADISVQPDFQGLPPNLMHGLVHLTNNVAALLLLVAGLGIASSLVGMVMGHAFHSQHVAERSRNGLLVSAGSGAILYVSVMAANYAMGLFR